MSASLPFSTASLSELQTFLRRLALGLVRDEQVAEDVVQQVWLSVLERDESAGRVGRGWLARAVRHLAINRLVAERRRAEREAPAPDEARPDPAELERRFELQAMVLDAVRRLKEPVRGAILLRYYDGLGPEAIARQLDVPLPTIKTRLARGRELLRADLGRELGDRDAWAPALASILVPARRAADVGSAAGLSGAASTFLGAMAMSAIGKVSVGVAVVALGALFLWGPLRGEGPDGLSPAVGAPGSARAAAPLSVTNASGLAREERTAAARPSSVVDEEPPAARAATSIEPTAYLNGRVLDLNAAPLARVRVVHSSDRATGVDSTSDGRFALAPPARGGRLEVAGAGLVTICSALAGPLDTDVELVLVAAPRVAFGGRVVDESGAPLEGARIEIALPEGFRSRFPLVMDRSLVERPGAASDANGSFSIPDGARVPGAVLSASLDGYMRCLTPLFEAGLDTELVLRRPGATERALSGLVVDASGRPVGGASVSFGAEVVSTDEHGAFRLQRKASERSYGRLREALGGESRTLRALKAGHGPAELRVELDAAGEPIWPDGIVLELGPAPGSISGYVLDPRGEPVTSAQLFLQDATLFSTTRGSCSVENLLGGKPDERITFFEVDATGRFELGGLVAERYGLVAIDLATSVQVRTDPIPTGSTDVRIVLDTTSTWESLSGRVVSTAGLGLPGVEVHVFWDATNFHSEGRFVRTSNYQVGATTTAEDGTFELMDVPAEHAYLLVMGDEVITQAFGGGDEPLGSPDAERIEDLELVVARRVHVQVTLEDPATADEIVVLDGTGEPLLLRVYQGKPGPPMTRAPFYGPRTDVLSLPDTGVELVYYLAGVEVRRRSIALVLEGLNEL